MTPDQPPATMRTPQPKGTKMLIPADIIMDALEAADTRAQLYKGNGHQIATDLHSIDFNPAKFAQFIADYVMENRPTSTTNTPEQEPSTTPAIGDTIPITHVQPGMTVKISDGRKRFQGKVDTVLTSGLQTEIDGIEFYAGITATITRQWAPPSEHITIVNTH